MQLPEVAIPAKVLQALMSKDPREWQTALVAVAVMNDRFSEAEWPRVHFYNRGTIQ